MKKLFDITARVSKITSAAVLAASLLVSGIPTVIGAESSNLKTESAVVSSATSENSYAAYKESIAEIPYADSDIIIGKTNLSGGNASVSETQILGESGCITFGGGEISASFTFNVPKTAKYNLKFDYAGLEGSSLDIELSVLIDGKLLWDDLSDIELQRWWKNSSDEWLTDRDGNQVTSEQVEAFAFREQYAYDKSGIERDYYLFALTEGIVERDFFPSCVNL